MRGVQVSAKVSKLQRRVNEDVLMYSAMGHTPLATNGPDDQVALRHISPFWAVMLAGRDTTDLVNMMPYMEEYKFPHPVAKFHGEVKPG